MAPVLARPWHEPLDVAGFARAAVDDACRAVGDLTRARGAARTAATSDDLIAGAFRAAELLSVAGRAPQPWAPLSGFFPCGEGWVRTHGNYPHHADALLRALGADSAGDVPARLSGLTALDAERTIRAAGGIAAAVRTHGEWAATEHGRVTAGEPWWTVELRGDRAPGEWACPGAGAAGGDGDGDPPLRGVRVLDLTRVIAGPVCAQLLACLGADVLRIDPPHRPELLDQYLALGMGKRSVAVDLGDTAEIVRRDLLPRADVVLHGYRPGSLARFGLDPDALAADFPGLVIGSLSAWGEAGAWAPSAGFDSIVQAAAGIAHLYGDGERPGALPVQALDHATGYRLAARVLDALAAGTAATIRISLLGAARELLARPGRAAAGEPERSHRAGSEDLGTGGPEGDGLVAAASPHGELRVAPPAVLVDGRVLARDVGGYGAAEPTWNGRVGA